MTSARGARTAGRALVGLALVMAGCTGGTAASGGSHPPDGPITVASFDFVESEVLAQLYGQALESKGYPVRLVSDAGTRELVVPALAEGLVDLVPEYSGSALSFLTLGARRASPSVEVTHQALIDALASSGAVALAPAPAQDANAIVVSQATAARYALGTISHLANVASKLTFGGPPECRARPLCLQGLAKVYGLTFGQFVPLDTGGPLTLQALRGADIDVALLFTTDPAIAADHLAVLADNLGLQPAENVTPIVRQAVLSRYGSGVADAINAVSARLTTQGLQALIGQVTLAGQPARVAAARWLEGQGLS